jgi:Protein of unknown function (DUF998)
MNRPLTIRILIACGAIGPPVFIVVFLIEGATRPGYSAWHNFVSSLSLSSQGWMQILTFCVCGFLMLGFALGLRRVLQGGHGATWGPLLLGAFGLALIAGGLFTTDPSLGYPPGAPNTPTFHGKLHDLASLVAFGSLAAANFVLARRFAGDPTWRGWTLYSIVTGILVVVFYVAATVAGTLDANGVIANSPAGLLQRLSIVAGFGWVALFALRLLGKGRASASTHRDAVEADAARRT